MGDDAAPERLTGRLLLASPQLEDPNFRRAVVLILEHNDDGALGVVLNRPSTAPLADALPQWEPAVAHPRVVFIGGPVQQTAALALGWAPDTLPDGGLHVIDDRIGTVDLDSDPATLGLLTARVFAGYAGWGADQLEHELLAGGWIVVDSLPGDVFAERPQTLWHDVLRRQPAPLSFTALFPDDPSLN